MSSSSRAIVPVLLLFLLPVLNACGTPEQPPPPPRSGADIYVLLCTPCHGIAGNAGVAGAKHLDSSTRSRDEMLHIVTNGKGAMMPYRNQLTSAEIEAVVDHALTLRNSE